ncbi:MAG: flagellar hook-associated protein FlgK [Planctomycetia bacterium]|nr:flagellar hook-associated protein FlgK [Planctomycetia bacterium]
MSLFGILHLGKTAIRASQIGLQVVGQNIANANTPGYIREEAVLQPGPTQRLGSVTLGTGVQVDAIIQKIDRFLEGRLRGATSGVADATVQEQTYRELEARIGELGELDLSTAWNDFFNSIHEILNQPESEAIRNLAVLQGKRLADDIRRLEERVRTQREELDQRVRVAADTINGLTREIRDLNLRIAQTEGGDASASDAVGLRDQRSGALAELAELIDIRVDEQQSGQVTVSVGGTFLVADGVQRDVEVGLRSDRGLTVADIQIADTNEKLNISGGEVHGLVVSRDEILGGFLDQLNDLSATFIFEFNQLYSSGQGLTGYEELTSEFGVTDASAALDAAGLTFNPRTGAFQVLVRNQASGLTETFDVRVDLDGLDGDDTTLADLVAQLDAIDGLAATILPSGQVQLASESADQEFAFAGDTSGVLAALGINTFFTGTSALTIGVSQAVIDDPGKFAASRGGISADTENAVDLAAFFDRPLDSQDGRTLLDLYAQAIDDVAQGSAVASSVAEGDRVFEETLLGQHLAISGVSIDEEVVRMVQFQRAFQAAAKVIATADELLGVLMEL